MINLLSELVLCAAACEWKIRVKCRVNGSYFSFSYILIKYEEQIRHIFDKIKYI